MTSTYKAAPAFAERQCRKCGDVKRMRKGRQHCDDCAGLSDAAIEEVIEGEKLLDRSPALGYVLSFQEGDYVIEQESSRGLATVWLLPTEALEIAEKIRGREELK
jgi:hypothetical protein